MLLKCVLLFVLVVSVTSEEDENHFPAATLNGITYRIRQSDLFYSADDVAVVRKGAVADILDVGRLSMAGMRKVEPGAFRNLPNLTYLVFLDCSLGTIEAGIFNDLKTVRALEVLNCRVHTVAPRAFENMTSLRSLHLDYNRLTRIDPSWFSDLPALSNIYLSHNFIEEIPADVIADIDGDKTFLLVFVRNKIKRIHDDAFRKLKAISVLNLDGNELETFNWKSLRDVRIQQLGLEKNKIVCLDERDFDKIFVATTTSIDGNPWDSQCVEKIIKWGEENEREILYRPVDPNMIYLYD